MYSCHHLLISSASVRPIPFLSFYCAHLCMKCSLGISNFLEEISSLSHSIVFLYFFAMIIEEDFFLSLLPILCNSALRCLYLSFSPLLFTSLLFTAIYKASSDNHFAFFAFIFLRDGFDHHSYTMSQTSVHSSSSTFESNPLNLFVSYTV